MGCWAGGEQLTTDCLCSAGYAPQVPPPRESGSAGRPLADCAPGTACCRARAPAATSLAPSLPTSCTRMEVTTTIRCGVGRKGWRRQPRMLCSLMAAALSGSGAAYLPASTSRLLPCRAGICIAGAAVDDAQAPGQQRSGQQQHPGCRPHRGAGAPGAALGVRSHRPAAPEAHLLRLAQGELPCVKL